MGPCGWAWADRGELFYVIITPRGLYALTKRHSLAFFARRMGFVSLRTAR
jgi:hypothetical protein